VKRVALALVAAAVMFSALPSTAAARRWAAASSAKIHPGVPTYTNGAQCTANFVYRSGSTVYLGQAAHCSGTGSASDTDGCHAKSLPNGTKVDIGGSKPGVMVYNSWLTMQRLKEKNANTCAFNDLALVKVNSADVGKVNPSIPFWGGPTGIVANVPSGAKVLSYGNSDLRFGITELSPKQGAEVSQDSGGWNHTVYTATPGIPGDSGSAYINAQGRAFGVLSTIDVLPLPGSNGVGNLSRELSYMRAHSSFGGVTLVNGTTPFRGPLL
jgi:hypothetical protein